MSKTRYYKIKCDVDIIEYTLPIFESHWTTRLPLIGEKEKGSHVPLYPKFLFDMNREEASHEGFDEDDLFVSLKDWNYMYKCWEISIFKKFPKDYLYPGAYLGTPYISLNIDTVDKYRFGRTYHYCYLVTNYMKEILERELKGIKFYNIHLFDKDGTEIFIMSTDNYFVSDDFTMDAFYSPNFQETFNIKSYKELKSYHILNSDVGYLNGIHNWWIVSEKFKQVVESHNLTNIVFIPLEQ